MYKNTYSNSRGKEYKIRRASAFTKEELIKLFSAMSRERDLKARLYSVRTAVAALIALTTGLRLGEIVKLKKRNLKFERNKIEVIDGKSGDALVDFHPFVQDIVRNWVRFTADSEWLFPSREDWNMHIDSKTLHRHFIKYLERADLWESKFTTKRNQTRHMFTFHSLRHSFATQQLEVGVGVQCVQQAMRHRDIKTTVNTYGHVRPSVVQKETFNAFWKVEDGAGQKISQIPIEMPQIPQTNPIQALQMKLVNGEVSEEEYQRKMALLQGNINIQQSKADYVG